MRTQSSIPLGAGAKLGAEILGRALQFVLIYVAQRTLGPAEYGQLAYAMAIGVVLVPVTDLGLPLTVTQQVSQRRDRARLITGSGLALKLALAVVAVMPLVAVSASRPPGLRLASFAVGLSLIVGSFVEFFGYAFRGLQRVHYDAALGLATRAMTVGLGLWMLASGFGVPGLAGAYLAGAALGAACGYRWLRRRFFTPALALRGWHRFLQPALPLGVATVLSIAYTRTAVFLLDALQGPAAVGLYSVAQKLTEPLAIIPAATMAAVFPALVARRQSPGRAADRLATRALWLLGSVGALAALGGCLGGPWLIPLLYGQQYEGSIAPFQILSLAVLLTFLNYALTHFLIVHERRLRYLLFTAGVFVLNLLLCLLLIPRLGPAGAAVAALASEALLFVLCWQAIPWGERRSVAPLQEPMPRAD
jgi:O-antigen/teichoic acid export membrane protein